MADSDPSPPTPRGRRRWLTVAIGLVGLLVLGLVASAPIFLNSNAGNRLIAGRLTSAFAPGRLGFGSIRFSWTSPTQLADIVLDAPSGKAVVRAKAATLTPSLWGLVTRPGRLGTLSLEHAAFEVERRPDGSVDLAEALGGILRSPDSGRDLIIRADRATLDFRSTGLPEPIRVNPMDVLVHLHPSPEPTTFRVDLARPGGGGVRVDGRSDLWLANSASADTPDLAIDVVSAGWPIRARVGGVDLSGRLDGRVEVRREAGRLGLAVHSTVNDFHAAGAPLGTVPIDLASVRIDGTMAPSTAIGTLSVESGVTSFRADVRPEAAGTRIEYAARTSIGPPAEARPVTLSGVANYRGDRGQLELNGLALVTPFGTIRASGRVDAIDGPARLEIAGTLAPDYPAIEEALASRVEPGATLAGRPGAFRATGGLRSGDPMVVEVRIQLDGADAFGLRLGATAIDLRLSGRAITIAPIETTLNEGRLRLDPVLDLGALGGPVLRLGKGSTLADARINEEVSGRVLAFVAPILNKTTRASGLVSVQLDSAALPIGQDAGRKATVAGSVAFHGVEFAPGPLARQIVGIVAPRKEPGPLRLDSPVLLSIADGRIDQHGLAIPIGDITRVELGGWVDFDSNIGLVATVPVTPAMFGNNPLLGTLVSGSKVQIPIGGTLSAPKVDREAFNADLKDFGRDLLARGAGVGTLRLLDALTRPHDPNAPPPPTSAERKASRIERRNERRRGRGLDPLPVPGRP